MSTITCKTIRNELDELMLGETVSDELRKHLAICTECQSFHEKQTRLREIVGSLGTVSVPPDFDFRLRSRLATGHAGSNPNFGKVFRWSLGPAGAVAVSILVLIGAVLLVMNYPSKRQPSEGIVVNTPPPVPTPEPRSTQTDLAKPTSSQIDEVATARHDQEAASRTSFPSRQSIKKQMVAMEFVDRSGDGASVIGRSNPLEQNGVFPVDAAQQSLKVSLFDGRGNPRTISVPSVTFGSQRVIPTTTSYNEKGVW